MSPVDLSDELRERADENFRETFRRLAREAVDGMVVEQGSSCLIASGVPVPLFNPAFAPANVNLAVFQPWASRFYAERRLPWALVSPDHAPVAARARLADAGMFESQTMPVLTRPTNPLGLPLIDASVPITIRSTPTDDVMDDHRRILAAAFGLTDALSRLVLAGVPRTPLLRYYAAYAEIDGRPVGSAALSEAAGVAGVYNVATDPAFRRKGIAAALMRHVLADARALGLKTCVLQSSPAGMPLYQRLGFARLSTYTIFLEDSHA